MARRAIVLCLLVAISSMACSSGTEPDPNAPPQLHDSGRDSVGAVRSFSFAAIDGGMITSGRYRGRMTVVVLAATYDTASQAQARFVNAVVQRHTPRINALLLVLEPTQHLPLAQAFAASLGLRYDVALADEDTIAGKGPFPGLHHVPSIVVLDREGREVFRQLGVVDDKELSAVIAKHDPNASDGRASRK